MRIFKNNYGKSHRCQGCGKALPDGKRKWCEDPCTGARPYLYAKGDHCESCGVVPCWEGHDGGGVGLDIDHKDGNHENNAPENLQTLCASCHRIKSKVMKEGQYAGHGNRGKPKNEPRSVPLF
jgi:5-methylcytosine-specific restriction endonuclease McrA